MTRIGLKKKKVASHKQVL